MAASWMIVEENGKRKPIDLRTRSRKGTLAAVRRAVRAGRTVLAAYQGGPRAIALCPRVYPKPA